MPSSRFHVEFAGAIAGLVSGVAAALAFASLHAVIIVPIWNRMAFGVLSAMIAGAASGWAFAVLNPDAIGGSSARGTLAGARFGMWLWLAVVPVTAVDAGLRALGLARRYELLAVGVAIVVAVASGAMLGWTIIRSRRGAIAGATAALLLTIAMAGPVPVANSTRAMGIFLAVLPSAMIAGSVLGALAPRVHALMRSRSIPEQ